MKAVEPDKAGQWIAPVPASPIDYRDLLRRYIAHVWDSEGTNFIGWCCEPQFSAADIAELTALSEEKAS